MKKCLKIHIFPAFRSVSKLLNFAPNSIGVRLTGKLMFVLKIRCCYFRESIFPVQLNVELLYIIFLKNMNFDANMFLFFLEEKENTGYDWKRKW
jgi:hypothetical protein